jgi:hypothetical protein
MISDTDDFGVDGITGGGGGGGGGGGSPGGGGGGGGVKTREVVGVEHDESEATEHKLSTGAETNVDC